MPKPFLNFDALIFKPGRIVSFDIGKTYGDVVIDVSADFFDSGSSKCSNIGMHDSEFPKFGNVLGDLFCGLIDGCKRVIYFAFHAVKYT
jgi:hypothetical protein